MSAYKKNLFVGVTVLVALGLLGGMILRFSDAPFRLFSKPQMKIYFRTFTAEGVGEGTPVYYLGVSAGRVTKVTRGGDDGGVSVLIEATLDREPSLPANLEGAIRSQIIGGSSSISMLRVPPREMGGADTRPVVSPQEILDQKDIPPVGVLEPGTVLEAKFIDIIPREEFTQLATSLTKTSDEFRLATRELRDARIFAKASETIDVFRGQIERAGKVIDSVQTLVDDKKMREDVRQTLANFRVASESATRIGQDLEKLSKKVDARVDEIGENGNKLITTAQARLEEVSKQLTGRIEQVAVILGQVEAASKKLNEGNGAAARLLHDPALYENLLDTSAELKTSI